MYDVGVVAPAPRWARLGNERMLWPDRDAYTRRFQLPGSLRDVRRIPACVGPFVDVLPTCAGWRLSEATGMAGWASERVRDSEAMEESFDVFFSLFLPCFVE
jgi:hypothetical protein